MRKLQIILYIDPEQDQAIRELSRRTKIPMSQLFRMGLNKLLESTYDELGLIRFKDDEE